MQDIYFIYGVFGITDVEKLFKNRQDDRVGLLKESIQDINSMMTDRETLHKELLQKLDKIEMFISDTMPKTNSQSNEALGLYKELLKKKVEVGELKVAEKLNFWRDQALLKKELREHMKEFRDMQSKTNMMDNLLDL